MINLLHYLWGKNCYFKYNNSFRLFSTYVHCNFASSWLYYSKGSVWFQSVFYGFLNTHMYSASSRSLSVSMVSVRYRLLDEFNSRVGRDIVQYPRGRGRRGLNLVQLSRFLNIFFLFLVLHQNISVRGG